ncbi:hypothetical protein ACSW8Q_18175 (plasmid) [Clostridium perfringens]|uniref:Helix-turn-helix domain of resolvase n=2 Tax=Clostridium perfringens TaxID=1502 RepID=A0A8H9R0F8_CLOPF|nr:hypothetical protein [Clostridium perfringens]EIA15596.1 hypothetical protein HA1_16062 [Clostridium perfringens F262]HAT4309517.1 hypothetical protein [Clostridium perfringens]
MLVENLKIKSIKDLDNKIVMVNKEYLEKLKEYDIPYIEFTEENKEYFLVKRGVKKKKFNKNICNEIKKKRKQGKTYRALAIEYDCSTRTISEILKDEYL